MAGESEERDTFGMLLGWRANPAGETPLTGRKRGLIERMFG